MNQSIAIETRQLPDCLQSALRSVGYGGRDVRVQASERTSLYSAGGEGQRGFAVVVNMGTGERKEVIGAWGGGSIFATSIVDTDCESHTIPENGAVIKGSSGGRGTFAWIEVHPASLAPLLPSGGSEVTERESHILYAFRGLKGGEYRARYMSDNKVAQPEIDALVSRGLIKRNAAGACAITTAGKNAASLNGFPYRMGC